MNVQLTAEKILKAFGGKENIVRVTHCITRLRVTASDVSLVDQNVLNEIEGVQGLVDNSPEIQVIIGTEVADVYQAFMRLVGDGAHEDEKKVKNAKTENLFIKGVNSVLNYLSGSIVPILPLLCCAALIGTVCTILTTFCGLSTDSGTYIIFNTFYQAFYSFLPIFIGFGAAKTLGVNGFYGAFLGAIMVHSNISGVEGLDFFGISIPTMTYGSTIVPILLGTAFLALMDHLIGKRIPKVISFIFRPFVVLAITVPVTLIILGPLGTYVGNYVALGIEWIYETFGVVAIAILGFIFPLLIASGMGNAVLPIFLQLFLANGYEGFLIPASLSANIAVGAAVLAVSLKSKNIRRKQTAAAAGFTALCGITEPAIYGVALPLKKPILAGMIGGAVGGLIAGLLQVKMYAFNAAGLVTLPLFIAPDGSMQNFLFAVLSALIAAAVGFCATWFLGFDDSVEE